MISNRKDGKKEMELYLRRNGRFQLRTKTEEKQIGEMGRDESGLTGVKLRDYPGKRKKQAIKI